MRIGVICSPFIQEVVELLCKRLRVHVLFLNKWEKTEEIKRMIKKISCLFVFRLKKMEKHLLYMMKKAAA